MAVVSAPTRTTFALLIATLSILVIAEANDHIYNHDFSFTVDLIHRDSPRSPSYNSSISHFDRVREAFRRSIVRASHFLKPRSSSTTGLNIESEIIPSAGEYLMNISIGTPALEFLGIADTGSDLIWTQCKPCKQCFNQNPPLFDPKKSSSYHSLPCHSVSCSNLELEQAACGTDGEDRDTCSYSYRYGDRSFTRGTLAVDTLTVGSVSLPDLVFGCGHENGGTFDESGSGLIGLGGGPLSFASQLTKTKNGGKFSYCLVPSPPPPPSNVIKSDVASKISFGTAGIVSGTAGAVSTPLVPKGPHTFYYLTLEAVSVGDKRLPYKAANSRHQTGNNIEQGNIIIDSGTTLTLLPPGFYYDLASQLEVAINAERVSDPNGILSLCFRSKSDDDISVPVITAHFSGGADVRLQPLNTFARMEDDLVCFTMIPSTDVAIFGNLAQVNFLVGYDLQERTVSFKPAQCTELQLYN